MQAALAPVHLAVPTHHLIFQHKFPLPIPEMLHQMPAVEAVQQLLPVLGCDDLVDDVCHHPVKSHVEGAGGDDALGAAHHPVGLQIHHQKSQSVRHQPAAQFLLGAHQTGLGAGDPADEAQKQHHHGYAAFQHEQFQIGAKQRLHRGLHLGLADRRDHHPAVHIGAFHVNFVFPGVELHPTVLRQLRRDVLHRAGQVHGGQVGHQIVPGEKSVLADAVGANQVVAVLIYHPHMAGIFQPGPGVGVKPVVQRQRALQHAAHMAAVVPHGHCHHENPVGGNAGMLHPGDGRLSLHGLLEIGPVRHIGVDAGGGVHPAVRPGQRQAVKVHGADHMAQMRQIFLGDQLALRQHFRQCVQRVQIPLQSLLHHHAALLGQLGHIFLLAVVLPEIDAGVEIVQGKGNDGDHRQHQSRGGSEPLFQPGFLF